MVTRRLHGADTPPRGVARSWHGLGLRDWQGERNRPPTVDQIWMEVKMRGFVTIVITVAVLGASLFVFPAAESTSTQVFSRAGFAEGDSGSE